MTRANQTNTHNPLAHKMVLKVLHSSGETIGTRLSLYDIWPSKWPQPIHISSLMSTDNANPPIRLLMTHKADEIKL